VGREATHPAVKRPSKLPEQCMPTATVAAVVGASHFMISINARVMAGMIAQHVARAEHNGRSAAELTAWLITRGEPVRLRSIRRRSCLKQKQMR